MFTGIVTALGKISVLQEHNGDYHLQISVNHDFLQKSKIGDSIAINGACLTITQLDQQAFDVYLSAETVRCTTFESLTIGDLVNLEHALRSGDALDGHLVTGHVDCTGKVIKRNSVGDSIEFAISIPAELTQFVAIKGSICVDGVSLTVNRNHRSSFVVNIIPHTHTHTRFSNLAVNDTVNIEVDLIARYVARLMSTREH